MDAESTDGLIRVTEAARRLGVSNRTVLRWIDRKMIPAVRRGGIWKINPKELPENIELPPKGCVKA